MEDVGRARPRRQLNAASAATEILSSANDGDAEMEEVSNEPAAPIEVDVYELADPVSILDKISSTFEEQVESAKWSERKEALEGLAALLKAPRLEEGAYGPLLQTLVKRIGDANILVVIAAAGCIESMARGLRRGLGTARVEAEVLPALLERCKEKKASVLEALRSCLNAVGQYALPPGHELQNALGPFLGHKNPQVRAECLSWLSRAHKNPTGRKELRGLVAAVLPAAEDGSPEVRDAAARCLAAFVAVSGENTVGPLLEGLDKARLARVTELVEQLKATRTITTAKSASETKKATVAPVKAAAVAQPAPSTSTQSGGKRGVPPSTPVRPSTAQPSAKQARKEPVNLVPQPRHTNESALSFMEAALPAALFAGLADGNWKTRLEAVESLSRLIPSLGADAELLVRFLGQRPGWRESNFQVFQRLLQLTRASPLTLEAAQVLAPVAFEKLADTKLGSEASETLLQCTEQTGLAVMTAQALAVLPTQKAPKSQAEILNWLRAALLAFGPSAAVTISAVEVAEAARLQMSSASPLVRTAAIGLAAALRQLCGPEIRLHFVDRLPGPVMASLDAELSKAAASAPPAPTRFVRTAGGEAKETQPTAVRDEDVFDESQPTIESSQISSQERTELQFPADLLAAVGDARWQTRKEALDTIAGMVERANRLIRITGSEVFLELRARYSDSNKNLVIQALDLTGMLAEACGAPAFEKHHRALLPACLGPLADPKLQVRQAALRCLDAVGRASRLPVLLPALLSALAGSESPNLRRELLHWIANAVRDAAPGILCRDDALPMATNAINGLQDRTMEVRKASQALLTAIMASALLPPEQLKRMCQEQKPAALPVLQSLIDSLPPVPAGPQPSAGPTQAIIGSGLFLSQATDEVKAARLGTDRPTPSWDPAPLEGPALDALRAQMAFCLHGPLVMSLFAEQEAERLNAVSQLETAIGAAEPAERSLIIACSDLLLRWLTHSLPSMEARSLHLLDRLLNLVDAANARLGEQEAAVLIPSLMSCTSRQRSRALFRQLCRIYPASRLFSMLADGLANASQVRSRVVCLEEMQALLARNGLVVLNAPKHVPLVAGLVASEDSGMRGAALDVLARLVSLMGEQLGRYLSEMAPRERALLEERLQKGLPEEPVDEIPVEPAHAKASGPFSLDYAQFEARDRMLAVASATPTASARLAEATPPFPFPPPSLVSTGPEHPLDRVLHLIQMSPDLSCIQALQRLEDWLTPSPAAHADLLVPRLNSLLGALCVRLRDCACGPQIEGDATLKSRLGRYVTNALVVLVSEAELLRAAPQHDEILSGLLAETLSALTSDRLAALPDQAQLSRALNILLVKALEGGKPGACFRALLVLLEQAFRCPPASPTERYPEFVMKCIWKLTKQLPALLADSNDELVADLLRHTHAFLRTLPPLEWKARAAQHLPFEDLPLRTVKTILHELVSAQGTGLLRTLNDAVGGDEAESSFVAAYIRAMLQAAGLPITEERKTQLPEAPPELQPAEVESKLKEICAMICSKPNTRHGLAELYAFQQANPSVAQQIDSYLEALGSFFYKYIKRNLTQLDQEQRMRQPDLNAYKCKLAQMQQAMAEGGLVGADGDVNEAHEQPNDGTVSPVMKRLESPFIKVPFSIFHCIFSSLVSNRTATSCLASEGYKHC